MREILTDQMLHDMFTALERGETYEYQDKNMQISINPQGISIQYQNTEDTKEVQDFLHYCDELDDDLFIEVCESFNESELDALQKNLDTDNYKETINIFKTRVQEIAQNRLAEIINEADAEIKAQERIIAEAHQIIEAIHKDLEEATRKYNV